MSLAGQELQTHTLLAGSSVPAEETLGDLERVVLAPAALREVCARRSGGRGVGRWAADVREALEALREERAYETQETRCGRRADQGREWMFERFPFFGGEKAQWKGNGGYFWRNTWEQPVGFHQTPQKQPPPPYDPLTLESRVSSLKASGQYGGLGASHRPGTPRRHWIILILAVYGRRSGE